MFTYPDINALRSRIWFQHSLLVLACVFCYGGSLRGDFVFDDAVAIVRNADVTAPNRTLWSHIMRHDFWGQNLSDASSHKSFRPLTTLTFRWEHSAFGLRAAPMKLHNFLLHCAVTCGLMRLLTRLFPAVDRAVLFLGAALFAVHPVHAEAVAGVVGRAEVLCALWYVLALLVVTAGSAGGRLMQLATLLALGSLAVLSKEVGVMVLPMCWCVESVDAVFGGRGKGTLLQRVGRLLRWRSLSLVMLSLGLIVARLWAMDFQSPTFKEMDNPVAAAPEFLTRVLSQQYLYTINSWLLLCPDWLSFDWALGSVRLVEHITDPRCAAIVALIAFIGVGVLSLRRDTVLALALLIVPFLPASGLVGVGFVVAERVLYVPSMGFCALIALGLDKLCSMHKKRRHMLLYGFAVVLAINAMRCRWRAAEWTDEATLYKSALRVCPNNAKVHYNIAKMLADRNDHKNAVLFYEKAISLYPAYEVAHTNLGNLYREQQKLDLAETHLRTAIAIQVEFPPAWMNLGIVLAAQGRYDEALLAYRRALDYRPKYATCLYNIGNLYISINNETAALKFWTEAVELDAQLTQAWANILAAHDNAGRSVQVFRISELALRWLPDEPTILFIRANAFGKLRHFAEAEELYLRVLAQRPNHALYYVNLGVLYHRWNRLDVALKTYQRALELDPTLVSARENMAKLARLKIEG